MRVVFGLFFFVVAAIVLVQGLQMSVWISVFAALPGAIAFLLLRGSGGGSSSGPTKATKALLKQVPKATRNVLIEAFIDKTCTAAEVSAVRSELDALAQQHSVQPEHVKACAIVGWGRALDRMLDDNLLTAEEERRLYEIAEEFGLSAEEINIDGAVTRLAKVSLLRRVAEGDIPEFESDTQLSLNLRKSEKVVWVFAAQYYEDRTRREYQGRSAGVSVRIAKGVYYRTGAFRGRPVDVTETVRVDDGLLVLTDLNLYFNGRSKSFRVPYDSIVAFDPYADGVGIMRDSSSAKPQRFVTGDGWFTFNLLLNLARRD